MLRGPFHLSITPTYSTYVRGWDVGTLHNAHIESYGPGPKLRNTVMLQFTTN